MKKYIYLIPIIIIIIIITFITYNYINKKNVKEEKIIIIKKENDVNNVISISIKEETEGGYIYYKTEDKKLIEKIIIALNNIQIGKKVDMVFNDDGRYYIINYNDGTTLTYYFQNNYYNKDNINYMTYNYDDLKKIKIPKE